MGWAGAAINDRGTTARRRCHRGRLDAEATMAQQPQDHPTRLNPGDEAPAGVPGTGENLCRECGGSGRIGNRPCPECGGTGKVIEGIGGA